MKNEPCIFANNDKTITMAIYVDDGAIFAKDESEMNKILSGMKKEFEISIFDYPKTYVGFEISKTPDSLELNQPSYVQKLLEKYEMVDAHPVRTPMATKEEQKSEGRKFPYREMVGSLLYVSTKSRPDLAYPVSFCSRHLENLSDSDHATMKRCLRYLKGTKHEGISYSKNSPNELVAYCDSDFAGDTATRRSTSGYVIYYGGGPVSWRSRKPPHIATSSTEAEFISAAECCRELLFLRSLLFELIGENLFPITMFIDNLSCIDMIKKGKMNARSKHIEVKYYFIKEKYDEGFLKLVHCPTAQQTADIFTKPLGFIKFEEFKKKLVN